MSFTLGRASLTDPRGPYNISVEGAQVSFAFDLVAASVDELKALRQQLYGLLNNGDEPCVPFTWSQDSSLDGFYTVTAVTLGPSITNMLNTFWIPGCTVSMTQVVGFSNPVFEQSTQSVVRTNTAAITTPNVVVLSNPTSTGTEFDFGTLTLLTAPRRDTEDSACTAYTVAGPFGLKQVSAVRPPSLYYAAAAKLELLSAGGLWFKAMGRNIPFTTTGWRISNGFIRLAVSAAGAGTIEVWNGSTWGTAIGVTHIDVLLTKYNIGRASSSVGAAVTLSVLRNSAEAVVVRISEQGRSVTYSLQAGAACVLVSANATNPAVAQAVGVGFTTNTGATAVTADAIQATANDVNSNRLVFAHSNPATVSTANGYIIGASVNAQSAMIGVEFAGSAAVAGNTAANVLDQYLGQPSITQRIVSR